jgi:two-component system chemotaxis response regulator CheB
METPKMIIIGSSGAGLPILKFIFRRMPRLQGPIVLVQHMPRYINAAVRDQLAGLTDMAVKIADHNERLAPGYLYMAPSETHITLVNNDTIQLKAGEKVNYVCPSIDVAMMSLVKNPPVRPMGILLSGVGDDGVKGIRHIKKIGGATIALSTQASTITGMAQEAAATGDVDFVLNPDQIREKIIEHFGRAKTK